MSKSVNLMDVANSGSIMDFYLKKFNVETPEQLQEKLKRAYYEDSALVSDDTYDRLFPVDPLGYTVEATIWPKFKHLVESDAMVKYKKLEDAQNFMDLNNYQLQTVEHKLDGINMKLYYEKGQLVHAVTRGSGVDGEDILPNAMSFNQLPQTIPVNYSLVVVEGEIVMSGSNFDKIKGSYSNRRNAVAGIARRLDGQHSELIDFYAYTLYEPVNGKIEKFPTIDGRQKLKQYGFTVPENLLTSGKSLEEIYKEAGDTRSTNEKYITDGLVLKAKERQFALKYAANTGETKVIGYRWELGNTHKLVPVVLYETINIGGANYSKASIASARNYQEINAPIGSIIEIARANEVIPYLKRVVHRSDAPLDLPTDCPVCGAKLVWNGAHLMCENQACGNRLISNCQRICAILDLRGLTVNALRPLIDNGTITSAAQILTLTPDQLIAAGKSEKVALSLVQLIRNVVSGFTDKAIFHALNLPSISYQSIVQLENAAMAKGKTLQQVMELQDQECYDIILATLKAAKAKVFTTFMISPEGAAYYGTIKAIVDETKA